MEINKSIFKSYDIRGIYPEELNEATAYHIGRAFVRFTGAKNVVVCQDARLSSMALLEALAKGMIAENAGVQYIGQLPTECLYFAVAWHDFDAGVMITASHNPKEYNGFKMIVKKVKIVVDASNGVIGNVLSKVTLPVEIIPLNFRPDGNFPNHAPNPLEPGSSDQIKEAIKQHGADFGFMFDGDADRTFLVNEAGALAPADMVLLLLAKYFLRKNPKAAIAYNAICSKAVPEFVKKWGGIPVRTQVGAVNVRDGLLKNNGVMGGEVSAPYCFRDYFYMD